MVEGKTAEARAPAPDVLPLPPPEERRWERVDARHAALLTLLVRGLITFSATYVPLRINGGNRIGLTLALSALWLVCLYSGFTGNATELLALGPSAAVLRG